MNDALWKLVEDAFDAARRHFELAVALHDKDTMSGASTDAYYAGMAFMHGMFAAHSSVENGLERILDLYQEAVPTGKTSHLDIHLDRPQPKSRTASHSGRASRCAKSSAPRTGTCR